METGPPRGGEPAGSRAGEASLAITWLGHASVLVETGARRAVFDPVLRRRVGPLVRIAPLVRPQALGPVDLVLLSHLHADHADLPTLRALKRSGPLVVPRGAGAWFSSRGLGDVLELRQGQAMTVADLDVEATKAVHDRGRRPLGPAGDPLGYLLSGGGSVYFAGDTDLFPEMEALRGRVDVALLPVWGWGKRLGPGHLDPQRAAEAAALIAPAVAIPIHWGTLRLGLGRGRSADVQWPARQFLEFLGRRAPAVRGRIMAVGERLEI